MTRLLLIALGTRGDVQPAAALGRGLRDAGHVVTVLAGDDFADLVGAHDLAFAPSGIDMQALMQSPDGIAWAHARSPFEEIRRMRLLFQRFGLDSGRAILAAAEGADALVGAFTADAFGLAVAEKLGKPYFTTALQPLHPTRSGAATSQPIFARRESVLNRWSGRLTEWLLFGVFETAVHAWRRELGLAPCTRRGYFDQLHAAPTLCGFSRHVVPRPRDWPDHKVVTGYWFLDEEVGWSPPADLVDFLAAGPPPVYVGFGSMSDPDGAATGGLILRALRRQGLRAVLAQGWAGLGVGSGSGPGSGLPAAAAADVFVVPAAPHAWLFPRMAGVVHHGGAGTTAAAFRAGVPQLVIPHFADQPFWGRRTRELGVGARPIARRDLTEAALARGLADLVGTPALAERAADLGAAIRAEDGVGAAVAHLGRWLAERGMGRSSAAG